MGRRGSFVLFCFFFQAEGGIRDAQVSRGLGDVYKSQPPPLLPLLRVKRQQKQPISLLLSIYSYHPTAGIGEEKGWLTFLLCGKWVVVEACFCRVDKSEASSPDDGRRAHRYRHRRHHHHQQLQIEKYRTRAHLRLTRRIIGMSRPRSIRAETNLQRLQKL